MLVILFSLPFASIYLVNPKPLTLLFSLGSFLILTSIFMLVGAGGLIDKSGSQVALVVYTLSLASGLYCGMFYVGYFNTLGIMIVQVVHTN